MLAFSKGLVGKPLQGDTGVTTACLHVTVIKGSRTEAGQVHGLASQLCRRPDSVRTEDLGILFGQSEHPASQLRAGGHGVAAEESPHRSS